uniref:uncharacterized protein LOC109951403 isoform X2 n=1 Tax=Monopterus albus TaxID=43700 RepID=UPI0009B3CD5F|nr:uncharacterized protein LOC109951403 isoform X2 [Monopterus albus]
MDPPRDPGSRSCPRSPPGPCTTRPSCLSTWPQPPASITGPVNTQKVLDWFQLNTPPPVMSACSAPPNRPDLFRSGPHPIRNLGSPTLRMPTNCQPNQAVLQLTQEEDQGVTNLLTLHYQSVEPRTVPVELNSSLGYQTPTDSTSDGEVHRPLCRDVQQRGGWSHTELEAANTLLNHFSLVEENHICSLNHHKSSGTLSGPLPDQHHEAPSVSTETQPECEASPALVTSHCTQSDTGYISFRSVRENGGQGRGDCRSAEHRTVYGAFSGLREQMLSDLEEDAVLVLLSLSDMGTLDTVQ